MAGEGKELHLFHNDGDFVIAESPEEARLIAAQEHWVPLEEVGTFELFPDAELFNFYEDTRFSESICKTAADWVKQHGKGYFATSGL